MVNKLFDAKENFDEIVNTEKKDDKGRMLYKYEPGETKEKRIYKHSLAEQDIKRRVSEFEKESGLVGIKVEREDFFNQFKVVFALLKLKGIISEEDYTDVEHLYINSTICKLEAKINEIKKGITAAKITSGIFGPDGKPINNPKKLVKG